MLDFTSSQSLVPRGGDPSGGCTKETCDPSQSIYGYRPDLAATLVFLIVFFLSGVAYTWQGIRSKTWFFSIAMLLGSFGETIGYVSKVLMWNNPFSGIGFKMSVVLLTFSPAFFSAGIYYTLKHIALTFGSDFSRLRPSWYTWVFISADLLSIALQSAGGGIAAGATDDAGFKLGNDVMIAGLVFQVFTLLLFGMFAADYGYAVKRNQARLNPATETLRQSRRFKVFLLALTIAYFAILIRCGYRVAELAKGWGPQNNILRDQWLFVGLDSVPCAIAALVLNVWHPGWCFPKDQQDVSHKASIASGSSSEDEKQDV